jgi:hypothetical protein
MFFMVICIETKNGVDFQLFSSEYFFEIWLNGKII